MMSDVICLGWYGHGNIGDEAYKIAFPKLFPQNEIAFTDTLKATDPKGVTSVILGGGNVLEPNFVKDLPALKEKGICLYAMSVNVTSEEQAKRAEIFDTLIVRDIMSLSLAQSPVIYQISHLFFKAIRCEVQTFWSDVFVRPVPRSTNMLFSFVSIVSYLSNPIFSPKIRSPLKKLLMI